MTIGLAGKGRLARISRVTAAIGVLAASLRGAP
jgi:hypothetical protein